MEWKCTCRVSPSFSGTVWTCKQHVMYVQFFNIYFRQQNCIIKAWVKANVTCFDLKSHHHAKLRTMKFFRVWLCAFGIQDGLQFCCDSYYVPNLIYIYYTIVIILWSSMWHVLFLGGHCSLIGLLVVMSIVVVLVLLLISFLEPHCKKLHVS